MERTSPGMTKPPQGDTMQVSPDCQTVTISPERATITISPKRNTITVAPDTITVSPDRKKIVVPSPTKPDFLYGNNEKKKIYRPSDTFRLVQQEDAGSVDNGVHKDSTDGANTSSASLTVDTNNAHPARYSPTPLRDAGLNPSSDKVQSRSFRMLEKQLE